MLRSLPPGTEGSVAPSYPERRGDATAPRASHGESLRGGRRRRRSLRRRRRGPLLVLEGAPDSDGAVRTAAGQPPAVRAGTGPSDFSRRPLQRHPRPVAALHTLTALTKPRSLAAGWVEVAVAVLTA